MYLTNCVVVFFLLKILTTSDRRPPSHGVTADISARRGGNARFQSGTASSDVRRGRIAVARVRTDVYTRHRRLEEERVGLRKRIGRN